MPRLRWGVVKGVSPWVEWAYYNRPRIKRNLFLPKTMATVPSIDLHPEKIPGGADQAVRACRTFLDKVLAGGHRQARIITGLGLRGDGTARLRARVEKEVLAGLYRHIEQAGYEQGGAVIRLWFKSGEAKSTPAGRLSQRREDERRALADREARFLVAWDRLDAADAALEEGDLRRCRLKLNQTAREFGWPLADAALDAGAARALLDAHYGRLKDLDR